MSFWSEGRDGRTLASRGRAELSSPKRRVDSWTFVSAGLTDGHIRTAVSIGSSSEGSRDSNILAIMSSPLSSLLLRAPSLPPSIRPTAPSQRGIPSARKLTWWSSLSRWTVLGCQSRVNGMLHVDHRSVIGRRLAALVEVGIRRAELGPPEECDGPMREDKEVAGVSWMSVCGGDDSTCA